MSDGTQRITPATSDPIVHDRCTMQKSRPPRVSRGRRYSAHWKMGTIRSASVVRMPIAASQTAGTAFTAMWAS